MAAEHNKAYTNFKRYNEGLKEISITEEVEGGRKYINVNISLIIL